MFENKRSKCYAKKMQNSKNNSKMRNSKKDSLPGAEIQNNSINFRIKKYATSINRKYNNNNKIHKTNNNHTNTNAMNSNNAKTTAVDNFHNKGFKSNGCSKHISTSTILPTKTKRASTPAAAVTFVSSSIYETKLASKEANESELTAGKPKKTPGTLSSSSSPSSPTGGIPFGNGSCPNQSSQQQQKKKQSQQYEPANNKARHYSFNDCDAAAVRTKNNDKIAVSGVLAINDGNSTGETISKTSKTKKSWINPVIPDIPAAATASTDLTILQKHSASFAAVIPPSTASSSTPSTGTKQSSSSSSLSTAACNRNGNSNTTTNFSKNNNSVLSTGGGGGITNFPNPNNHKNFQIPSDVLDDLASRFVINVPDMELSNLIRICFQIELAHWFYLDFFCTGINDDKELLKPVGMKYFAVQLFQHIPFLSHHLPMIDTVLEDWKNYKLAVPTYGAILISEDLQYCLLVQSYFAKSSWGFPKGKVNETEDPEHCATREVFEETGYDITGLIVPKDYIEAVINDQYTRLYIVCNVSLETIFAPRTRNEIRCCVWFPIDSLPNNKSDAISKAKLGQNANSFFMILPFVKRLKKWVNEKRAKAGIGIDNNNAASGKVLEEGVAVAVVSSRGAGGVEGGGDEFCLRACSKTINGNNTSTHSFKSNDRRTYGCQSSTSIFDCAIIESTTTSLGDVGEINLNDLSRSNVIINTNSSKKIRQQQQHQKNSVNNSNSNNDNKSNNISSCSLQSNEMEKATATTAAKTFVTTISTNAVAASAAVNAHSNKKQRHKSMGDSDNMMNSFNDSNLNENKNSKSGNKNANSNQEPSSYGKNNSSIYSNKGKSMQKLNTTLGSVEFNYKNGIRQRHVFYSQSQSDSFMSEIYGGGVDGDAKRVANKEHENHKFSLSQTTNSFGFIHEQQQRVSNCLNYEHQEQEQKHNIIQHFSQTVSISDDQICTNIRQHADEACGNNNVQKTTHRQNKQKQQQQQQQQQFQLKTIKNFYFNKTNSPTTIKTRSDLHRISMVTQKENTTPTKSETTTTAENKLANNGGGSDINSKKNNAIAGVNGAPPGTEKLLDQHHQQQRTATVTGKENKNTEMHQRKDLIKSVVEASAIETQLIEEQKLIHGLQGVKSQKPIPITMTVQQQQQQQKNGNFLQPISFSAHLQQQQNQHQHQHYPLQHSSSSPGLSSWRNFSFTKNIISNVFL